MTILLRPLKPSNWQDFEKLCRQSGIVMTRS